MAKPRTSTDLEMEGQLNEVAKLYNRGCNQSEIAKSLPFPVSQVMVSRYLQKIRERYRDAQVRSYGEAVQTKLDEYRAVRFEAWQAWERSKEDAESSEEEKELRAQYRKGVDGKPVATGGKLQLVRALKSVEGRLPGSEYLKVVLACLEKEAELEGLHVSGGPLEKPKGGVGSGGGDGNGEFPWERLFGKPPGTDVVGAKVEAEIQGQLAAKADAVQGTYEVKPGGNGSNGDGHSSSQGG